jgi:signal transduction histidine kinase
MNLKTSLILRIVLVGSFCFVLVMGGVLFQAQRATRQFAFNTADLVARHLELQRLKIDANFDSSIRFPDWDAITSHTALSGQCTSFTAAPEGRMLRSSCVGSTASKEEPPRWFSWLHRFLFSAAHSAEREVIYKSRVFGIVRVSTDPISVIGQSWRELMRMLLLTIVTVLSLCLLVYFAIERALAPAKTVVTGLNRLADGAFDHRLPNFQLAEFQRIGEVTNQLAEKIQTSLSEGSDLLKRLMTAQERERSYLARELHDEFAQNLTAINAFAVSIGKSAEEHYPELSVEAENLSQISTNMMDALRKTLFHLKPADLDRFGLVESLAQLITLWNATSGGQTLFRLDAPYEIKTLPEEAAIHIFRIAQEALTNAAKHARAKSVRLNIEQICTGEINKPQEKNIRLVVEDDGEGGYAWQAESPANGMGILNMRERVAALGGTISFYGNPGTGLAVHVTIPVHNEQGTGK